MWPSSSRPATRPGTPKTTSPSARLPSGAPANPKAPSRTSPGEVVEISREDYCSVTLMVDGDGVIGDHGVTINGTLYAAGQSMSVYFGDCKLFLKVRSVEAA